ncbi:MAG: glycosyltransferase [Acidobacteria bacterium]|nr:glycosyltransferase [Acidobacteriota bacterium]
MLKAAAGASLHVCHVCATTLDSHYFANLGRGLHARGLTVSGVSLVEPETPSWLREIGGDYECLGARRKTAYLGAIARLARWLRGRRVDVVQTHLVDGGIVGLAAARLARVPLVVLTRHHTSEIEMIGTRLHGWCDRLLTSRADRVVVLSQAVKTHMVRREGASPDKIEVIYQGFDFDALSATDDDRRRVRADLGLGDAFVIGCVARFFRTKGHPYLLGAARELARDIPNLKVLLLGGGDREAIEAMVRGQGLADRVIFAGYRRDVPACMRAMDVVVHPSLTEAFCQTVVEALAAGAPLVATNVAAAPEVVTDGVHGLLVPRADAHAIAAAVLRLYRDPALGRRMADEGRRSVRERFTIDRMVTNQIDCYRRWLPAPPKLAPSHASEGGPAGARPA